MRLDVAANTRGLSVLALREAGHEVSEKALLDAAEATDVALCTLYLDAGVPVDCVDEDGTTPLHNACYDDGNLSLVTLLLDRGSQAIETEAKNGDTPLHLACANGDIAVVTLFLDRDCNFDAEKYKTCSPYRQDVLELLSERGHDVLRR